MVPLVGMTGEKQTQIPCGDDKRKSSGMTKKEAQCGDSSPMAQNDKTKDQALDFLLRARVRKRRGVPVKWKASRRRLARKRSKAKCSGTALSVKRTKVGGATAAWVM